MSDVLHNVNKNMEKHRDLLPPPPQHDVDRAEEGVGLVYRLRARGIPVRTRRPRVPVVRWHSRSIRHITLLLE